MPVAKKKPLAAPPAQPTKAVRKSSRAPVKQAAPSPAAEQAAKPGKKKGKTEKVKVVRDSFTIPKTEYAQIADMKQRATALGLEIKKSELIRAGLTLLKSTSDAAFRKALGNVPTLKTGRPSKA